MQIIFQDIAALIDYIRENTSINTEGEKNNNIDVQQVTEQFFRL